MFWVWLHLHPALAREQNKKIVITCQKYLRMDGYVYVFEYCDYVTTGEADERGSDRIRTRENMKKIFFRPFWPLHSNCIFFHFRVSCVCVYLCVCVYRVHPKQRSIIDMKWNMCVAETGKEKGWCEWKQANEAYTKRRLLLVFIEVVCQNWIFAFGPIASHTAQCTHIHTNARTLVHYCNRSSRSNNRK